MASTTSIAYIPVRMWAGLPISVSVTASASTTNLRAWLPHQTAPVVGQDRRMSPDWYRFFDYLCNVKLGGAAAPDLADVVTTFEAAQEVVTSSAQAMSLLTQQTQANAEALATTVEVAKNAALPGASSIPPVRMTYLEP